MNSLDLEISHKFGWDYDSTGFREERGGYEVPC